MKKTVIVYGSTTGTCESLAGRIAEKLGAVSVISASALDNSVLDSAENLILGTSTWGSGELQDDWYDAVNLLKGADLSGKTAALFGCGDSQSYPDTFCGGMSELYEAVKAAGARVVGETPVDGYSYEDSASVVDGRFVGLALDEDNESDKTEERISDWVEAILPQL